MDIVKNNIDYSIIIPVYYNEGSLKNLFTAINTEVVQKNPGKKAELIFVDDGSGDNSFGVLLELKQKNPDLIKIIKFTRNFGQPYARLAGYKEARGKCAIHISADLQDPPELINKMLKYYFEDGYNIVIGERTSRDESFYRRFTSKIFYSLMKKLCFSNMPPMGFDYHLIDRRVLNIIINSKETNPFVQGQILWPGFKTKFLPYARQKRNADKSRWTLSKKIKLLIDGLFGYSYFPIRIMSLFGFIISFLGFIYAFVVILNKIFNQAAVKGWAGIMVAILILSGFQMLMLGIIGEYLWRTLDQVRGRQPYIIEKIYS